MKEAEITEFKEVLSQFEIDLKREIKEDPTYSGEADHLIQAISRLQTHFKNINDPADYDKSYENIAADLECVMHAAVMFSDLGNEDDDFDLDDLEFEDEDEDELDDLEFADSDEDEEDDGK